MRLSGLCIEIILSCCMCTGHDKSSDHQRIFTLTLICQPSKLLIPLINLLSFIYPQVVVASFWDSIYDLSIFPQNLRDWFYFPRIWIKVGVSGVGKQVIKRGSNGLITSNGHFWKQCILMNEPFKKAVTKKKGRSWRFIILKSFWNFVSRVEQIYREMDKFTYKKERHLSASKVTLPSCIVGRNHWTCLVNWTLRTNEIIWTFSTTVELCTVCQNKVIFLIWTFDLVFIYPGCPEEATKATNYKPKVKSEDEQKKSPEWVFARVTKLCDSSSKLIAP